MNEIGVNAESFRGCLLTSVVHGEELLAQGHGDHGLRRVVLALRLRAIHRYRSLLLRQMVFLRASRARLAGLVEGLARILGRSMESLKLLQIDVVETIHVGWCPQRIQALGLAQRSDLGRLGARIIKSVVATESSFEFLTKVPLLAPQTDLIIDDGYVDVNLLSNHRWVLLAFLLVQ